MSVNIDYMKENLMAAKAALDEALTNSDYQESFKKALEVFLQTVSTRNIIYSCGNGGSMSDAIHFAEEMTGRFRDNRPSLPAIALSDPGHISCVGNDYGYDYIFSKFIEGVGRNGDVLLGISTSGKSKNVIEAVKSAKNLGMTTVGLLGKDGGPLKELVDIAVIAPGNMTDRIQEMHIKTIHCWIEGIERVNFPEHYQS